MTAFLTTLGSRLAERWLALLVLPGALYLVFAAAAVRLGHRRWYDLPRLRDDVDRIAADPAYDSPGAVVLILAGLLAGAAAVGLAVQAVGNAVERMWLTEADGGLALPLVRRRRNRWERAQQEFQQALVAAGRAQVTGDPDAPDLVRRAEQLHGARNRIGLAAPGRPFWVGDRLAAVDQRVHDRYRLDLAATWPRLWLIAPEPTRAGLGAARRALAQATRLAVWGFAIAALGVLWWPAVIIGGATMVAGWQRGRSAGTGLAELLESAVDLHGRQLAEAVGVSCPGPLTRDVGTSVTAILRKDT